MRINCDFLVVGSGVAGLTLALEVAKHGDVVIVTKRSTDESATAFAQGGIAAVMDPRDTVDAHVQDTLTTGGGLCDPEVVRTVVSEGPDRVQALIETGARFTRGTGEAGRLDLTREGGHSARRVVHAGDMTGREVQRALVDAVRQNGRIVLHEHHVAVDLIELSKLGGARRVAGAYVLDEEGGEVHTIVARETILATGGAGKVYLFTSNPDVATGDGVAMAYRAGAALANMEFFQFHPTCLFHPEARTFLISEALRGEGGILRLADGTPFMAAHHAMKDLAPRDVVARAIDHEIKRTGAECVYLDMSARDADYLRGRFPHIHEECMKYGIDMTTGPIPVVPAAHYMCGGVVVDRDGRTTLPGLWAAGEVTCSGLHGANRLASNSLLEGLVYGHRAGRALGRSRGVWHPPEMPEWDIGEAVPSDEAVVITHNWEELRRSMWNYVGIVRSDKRLRRAAARVALLQEEIREYYWSHLLTRDLIELRNIADVAEVIVSSATFRKESRGLHYTLDYPERDDQRFGAATRVEWRCPPHLAGR